MRSDIRLKDIRAQFFAMRFGEMGGAARCQNVERTV